MYVSPVSPVSLSPTNILFMYLYLYTIPWVSSPHVSGIVHVYILYMRSPESPVPRSPAFIYNPRESPVPRSPRFYIYVYLCVQSPESTGSGSPTWFMYVYLYKRLPPAPPLPPSIIFVDHHHLDQTRKPYQFLILPSKTVTHSNSFFRRLSDNGTKSPLELRQWEHG